MTKKIQTDLKGRPYALVSEVKVGTTLEADGGFDCLKEGSKHTVRLDVHGNLYIKCSGLYHGLAGQWENGNGECVPHYIGLYKCEGLKNV